MDESRSSETAPQRIPCEVCQHEIPLSEAFVPEASDYVAYFCSLDCYAAWLSRASVSYAGTR